MSPTARNIRTPDQRLRVFVSSTLKELAAERRAARLAVERLHLAPVMFELGARPHPPRDLYRAYLDQSDVFVGLYWERYGWVAPEEEVSGLEDEYLLAPAHLPKLMYIKQPADSREPRLKELLDRIRNDDTASFKYFTDADELGELLEADLATMLAERFDQSRTMASGAPERPAAEPEPEPTPSPAAAEPRPLPAPLTELIGRERELSDLERMLRRDSVRLVTLTGPGGIGKSRLAIAVANRIAEAEPGGAVFVALSSVHDANMVPTSIAQALGVRDTGDAPIADKLATALSKRRVLLVLDNFEQVLDAAPALTALLAAAPGLTLLVTSRILLRISGENSFEVGPLGLPDLEGRPTLEQVVASPAVSLFVERVHAVKPDFEVGADNVEAVATICSALDGVPLALELAAARVRVLSPASMLERLDRQLPLLVGGARDLPARQQTLRSTIEWSTQLLDDGEKRLLSQLGVFDGGFSLEAAEFVSDAPSDIDTLGILGSLVDSSLVSQHDSGARSRFSMLATVREYALEQLQEAGELDRMRERHAQFFIAVGEQVELELEGFGQREWMSRLTDDRDNLRAAARYLLDRKDWDRAAMFAWTLYIYWWVGGHLGEVRHWMDEVLAAGDTVSDHTRAIALYFTRAITFWQDREGLVVQGLTESAELFERADDPSGEALALVSLGLALLASETPDPDRADEVFETSLGLFRESGDVWGESMALVTLGRVALMQQKVHGALNRFEESLALTRLRSDDLGEAIALHHLGWAQFLLGDADRAAEAFAENLEVSANLGHDEGVAYGLEGLVAIAAMIGDVPRSGLMLGASETLRDRSGLHNAQAFSFHQPVVDEILAGAGAGEFEQARAEGRRLSTDAAVAVALEPAKTRRAS